MDHAIIEKFIKSKEGNSEFLEEKLRENIVKQKKFISTYFAAIVVTTIVYYILNDEMDIKFNFLFVNLGEITIVKFFIPFILIFLFIAIIQALSFLKDLVAWHRYTFAKNHLLDFKGNLYKAHVNDEVTRIILPYGAMSELYRAPSNNILRKIRFAVLNIPLILMLFHPVAIVSNEFSYLLNMDEKTFQDWLYIIILGLGLIAGMMFFQEYVGKLTESWRSKSKGTPSET